MQRTAGRSTTNDELEEMLESGNPAIFTQGVGIHPHQQNMLLTCGAMFCETYWSPITIIP